MPELRLRGRIIARIAAKQIQPSPRQLQPRRRIRRHAGIDRVPHFGDQARPFANAVTIVVPHVPGLFGREVSFIEPHLAFREGSQHVGAHFRRNANVLLHCRLQFVHAIQLHQQARISIRIAQKQGHPAQRQCAWAFFFGGHAARHLFAHFIDQGKPVRVAVLVPVHRQARQFFRGKILVVHGHEFQSSQPIGQFRLRALGQLALQLHETLAQARGLQDLAVEHHDLFRDDLVQGSAGLVQVGADFRQRQSETTQRLDLVQAGNIVAAI